MRFVNFSLRRYDDCAICSVQVEDADLALGMLNREEAKQLLEDFRAAVDDLEWFLAVTAPKIPEEKANEH